MKVYLANHFLNKTCLGGSLGLYKDFIVPISLREKYDLLFTEGVKLVIEKHSLQHKSVKNIGTDLALRLAYTAAFYVEVFFCNGWSFYDYAIGPQLENHFIVRFLINASPQRLRDIAILVSTRKEDETIGYAGSQEQIEVINWQREMQ